MRLSLGRNALRGTFYDPLTKLLTSYRIRWVFRLKKKKQVKYKITQLWLFTYSNHDCLLSTCQIEVIYSTKKIRFHCHVEKRKWTWAWKKRHDRKTEAELFWLTWHNWIICFTILRSRCVCRKTTPLIPSDATFESYKLLFSLAQRLSKQPVMNISKLSSYGLPDVVT